MRPHHAARDWGDLAATCFLAAPLIVELSGRRLGPGLIASSHRINRNTWKFVLGEFARWTTGEPVTALEVCQQIHRARTAGNVAALPAAMIERLTVRSATTFEARTRVPLAFAPALMANPGLSPAHTDPMRTTGCHVVRRSAPNYMTLESTCDGVPNLTLIKARSARGSDWFARGRVDVSGPMLHWPGATTSRVPRRVGGVDLDIAYALSFPEKCPISQISLVDRHLDRVSICRTTHGLARACSHFSDVWLSERSDQGREESPTSSKLARDPRPNILLYSAYPGNREMAIGVAAQLREFGIRLRIHQVSYQRLLNPRRGDRACYRLFLASSPWPHPSSFLAPFISSNRDPALLRSFRRMSANEDFRAAANQARAIELSLWKRSDLRTIVVGQVRGLMRSRSGHMWCPPSGWFRPGYSGEGYEY